MISAKRLLAILAAIPFALAAQPVTPLPPLSPPERSALEADLAVLLDWYAGDWDNAQQVAWHRRIGRSNDTTFPPERMVIARVAVPRLGRHVLYGQRWVADRLVAQQLYVFSVSETERALILDLVEPRDRDAARDAHRDPARIARLGPDDVIPLPPACRTAWLRRDDHFRPQIVGRCSFREKDGEKLIYELDSALSARALHQSSLNRDAAGNRYFYNPGGEPKIYRKRNAEVSPR